LRRRRSRWRPPKDWTGTHNRCACDQELLNEPTSAFEREHRRLLAGRDRGASAPRPGRSLHLSGLQEHHGDLRALVRRRARLGATDERAGRGAVLRGPRRPKRPRGSIPGTARIDPRRPFSLSALIVDPAFEEYPICAAAAGLELQRVFWDPRGDFPIDAVVGAIGANTRLIYLTDPNNPTGLPIPAGAIERIAAASSQTIVLVDEAYAEFSGRTLIGPALDRHPNLVVGRTFAKAHGLAALRIGALVAHPDTLAPLRRTLPPFSINICAVRALEAALGDRTHLDGYVRQSKESRRLIYAFCARLGLRFWHSEANFVLVEVGPQAARVVSDVAEQGILIKDRSHQPGCAGCIRITAGVVAHTEHCLAVLEAALASRPR
jgi:histidinol-phosphate/aromatic aminotransferase/cobyric acid decarboxylase-like protein